MKKNPLENLIEKIIWTKLEAELTIEDRTSPDNTRKINGKDIINAGTEFFFLNDGTMIPYHRIMEIKIDGNIIYKRKRA